MQCVPQLRAANGLNLDQKKRGVSKVGGFGSSGMVDSSILGADGDGPYAPYKVHLSSGPGRGPAHRRLFSSSFKAPHPSVHSSVGESGKSEWTVPINAAGARHVIQTDQVNINEEYSTWQGHQ